VLLCAGAKSAVVVGCEIMNKGTWIVVLAYVFEKYFEEFIIA
jgi:hypothetical protein